MAVKPLGLFDKLDDSLGLNFFDRLSLLNAMQVEDFVLLDYPFLYLSLRSESLHPPILRYLSMEKTRPSRPPGFEDLEVDLVPAVPVPVGRPSRRDCESSYLCWGRGS